MSSSHVYNEDNMLVMGRYPDKYFDIAIIDPQYGINAPKMAMGSNPKRKGKGQYPGISTSVKLKGRLNSGGGKLKDRILNSSEFDWDNIPPSPEFFKELFRVSKDQIIFGGNYFGLPPSRCIICWDKIQPWENFSQWEMAWTSFDKPAKMYRVSNTGGSNRDKKIHPTQKPIALYDKIYRDFVTKGMKILDTHLGSGSHRITASKLDVEFVGCEISKSYFDNEQKRYNNYISQLSLF